MATKTAAERPPGFGGRIDPQPRKVTVDIGLNEVDPTSEAAAFSYLPADLERVRLRREELGLNDDRERVQRESAKAELAAAERRFAQAQTDVENLRAQVAGDGDLATAAADEKPKGASKAKGADES